MLRKIMLSVVAVLGFVGGCAGAWGLPVDAGAQEAPQVVQVPDGGLVALQEAQAAQEAAQAWLQHLYDVEQARLAYLEGLWQQEQVQKAVAAFLHGIWVDQQTPRILDFIAQCEGYPRFVHADHGPESTASGKHGFLDGTWRSNRGPEGASYPRAMHAPEWVQDLAAARLYRSSGTRPWDASRYCWAPKAKAAGIRV